MRARRVVNERHQYWFHWLSAVWLAAGLVALALAGGCGRAVPTADASQGPAVTEATISGTVRGRESASSIDGRIVEAVNLATHERQRVTTNRAGRFTFKVRPGQYRVEVALRDGESVVSQPGVMQVSGSHADAHADFVIGTARVSRPRGPAYRVDHGLRGPIA
jgi:hypothetical protein